MSTELKRVAHFGHPLDEIHPITAANRRHRGKGKGGTADIDTAPSNQKPRQEVRWIYKLCIPAA